jgi:hypothetical protein
MVLQGAFSREEGSAVRRQGLESGTSGRTSVCDGVLQCLISASTCICAQSNREVQLASTSDGHLRRTTESLFSREELRRRKPRHSLHRVALGLCTEAESGIEHALSNHAKSESSRMGRDWAVMPTIRTESLHLAVDRGILTHPGGRRVGLQSSDKSFDAGAQRRRSVMETTSTRTSRPNKPSSIIEE